MIGCEMGSMMWGSDRASGEVDADEFERRRPFLEAER